MSAIRVGRIAQGTRPELAQLESRILQERGRISVLYQVLLNSEPIAAGWERLLTAVRNQSTVPANLRELAILRVAVLNRATFEFDAHVTHARQAGVSDDKIDAVRTSTDSNLYSPLERLTLELSDAMTRDIEVSDDLMNRFKAEFDDQGVVELVATIAAYNMVSRFLVALKVEH